MILGLQCYACDNEGSPEDCEENPSGISNGFVTCEPLEAENYCYTRRLEDTETGGENILQTLPTLQIFTASLQSLALLRVPL